MNILVEEEGKPSKELTWKMYFDGALNTLGHRIGVILISPEEHCYPFSARLDFDCTNNVAEYEACFMGLQAAVERKAQLLKV